MMNKLEKKIIEKTIHEGKNRIIRRMMKKLGYKVFALKRIKIGNLELGNLREGEYIDLKEKEKEEMFV